MGRLFVAGFLPVYDNASGTVRTFQSARAFVEKLCSERRPGESLVASFRWNNSVAVDSVGSRTKVPLTLMLMSLERNGGETKLANVDWRVFFAN